VKGRLAVTTGAATAGALAGVLLAACGSTRAADTTSPSPASAALPIATSLADPAGASWAVVELGGASAEHNNFWELFVRPAKASSWHVVTPAGAASNGGLIMASGATSQFAAYRPSQYLTFSPLAATTNQGRSWSQGNLVSPGLADVPDALAAGPGGQLLALSDTGTVRLGAHDGASWRLVASRDSLARSQAGRACGLTSLLAVAFSGTGTPLLGGSCRTPGVAGLFASGPAGWQGAGLSLPAALRHVTMSVVGVATFSGRTTALLAIGHGASAGIVVAWSGPAGTNGWTVSPVLRAGVAGLVSQCLWPGAAAGLVLAGSRGETIAGPGRSWHQLAPLPARTATLALGPAGQLEALATRGPALTAWQLGAGSGSGVTPATAGSRPASWSVLQTIKVPIPYGSSG
jgi:hypothetical protein